MKIDLKLHCHLRDITLAELARQADVSYPMVLKIQSGSVTPSLKLLVRLARVLRVSLDELVQLDDRANNAVV